MAGPDKHNFQQHRSQDSTGAVITSGFIPSADGTGGWTFVDGSGLGGGGNDTYQNHGNTGATETFDQSLAHHHRAVLDANCTFTFTGAVSGESCSMVLELVQDGTGSRTVTWPGSVVWVDGSAPTLSTTPAAVDFFAFVTHDGGTTWFGFEQVGGSGSALTIEDEGTPLATAATTIDFVGAGVTASGAGATKTVTIPGGATASDTGIWRPLMDGAGNVVTDGATGEAVMAFS